jgi:hypothetical protein
MASSSDRAEIDVSLRLWSEQISLYPLVEALDVAPKYLHIAGEPIASEGRLAQRRAPRHYASLLHKRVDSDIEVASWCKLVVEKIESQESLMGFMRSRQIAGTIWIAIFGPQLASVPIIPEDIINAASGLRLSLLIENYTDFDDGGVPRKSWLVSQT